MRQSALLVVAGCVAIAVGAALGSFDRPARPIAASTPDGTTTIQHSSIDVHVAGWVVAPGVVQVSEGSIAADAIEAAGGMKRGARSAGINLAAPLHTGDQIIVPGPESDIPTSGSWGDGLVAVNRASSSDLEELPGVGAVLAERIVAYREENGPFQEVEDLLDVPGIGEAKLESMRAMVRIP